MGADRPEVRKKGTAGEEEEDLLRKREFFHPRKLAKMAGLDPPMEPMYVVEHHDRFPHTDRVTNNFCTGLALFGMLTVFSTFLSSFAIQFHFYCFDSY